MSELALDDDERYALTGHLDRVRVTQLVASKAPANLGFDGGPSELGACSGGGSTGVPVCGRS